MLRASLRTFFLLLVITPCFFCQLSAQQFVYDFKHYTTNDGLPSSEVHQVLKDSRNYMWFATDHGVCRYDGNGFETIPLPDNSILSMYEDTRNRIWFVSFSGQLFYYENGSMHAYRYNDKVMRHVNQLAINTIYVDSSEKVFITTTAPNSFSISKEGEIEQTFHPDSIYHFNVFETDKKKLFAEPIAAPGSGGVYYIITYTHLTDIHFNTKGRKFTIQVPWFLMGRKHGAEQLKNGDIVFYGNKYLVRVAPDNSYTVKDMKSTVLSVRELDNEILLVTTIQDGLVILDKNYEMIDHYFPKLTVTSTERDYEGGLWVTTTQEGVFYLNSLQMQHLSDNHEILRKKVLSLGIVSDSDRWAGQEDGTILNFDGKQKLSYFNYPASAIYSINGGILPHTMVVCVGEIFGQPPMEMKIYHSQKTDFFIALAIHDIIKKEGEYYSGSTSGFIKMDFEKKRTRALNTDPFRVAELYLDSKGDVLVGNLFGLWRYREGRLYPYDSTKKILSTRITDIDEFNDRYLCLGTRGNGFLLLAKDSLYQLRTTHGLCSDNIRKIFIDSNIIWLATNNGISRLEIRSEDPLQFDIRNIAVKDGLLSNEVNDIKMSGSKMVIATNLGISTFEKAYFTNKQAAPLSIYITGVKINGEDTTLSDHYDLAPSQSILTVSFSALSYHNNAKLKYRYRLKGIDSVWIYTNAREVQLNPVSYGKFTLEVEASREWEGWNDNNLVSLVINRHPPFWMTTWFKVGCYILAAGILLLFFIIRTRTIAKREMVKTSMNKKMAQMELKALRAQMNPHFIFNVLNSIQYFIVHHQNDNAQYYMSKFAKLVRMTLDNSMSTFIPLAAELSLLRLYIELEKIRFEDRFTYEIVVDEKIEITEVKIPNMLLQPYVENSIKHGFRVQAGTYFLKINIYKSGESIVCVIADNGIGREKAALLSGLEPEKHTSTGTFIIKEKIEALKTYFNYNLISETTDLTDLFGNPAGTEVVLVFPEKFSEL